MKRKQNKTQNKTILNFGHTVSLCKSKEKKKNWSKTKNKQNKNPKQKTKQEKQT